MVYVVGHDPDMFAQGMEKASGAPKSLVMRYAQRKLEECNEGLTRLSKKRNGEVVIAEGCDHFVQNDGPEIVVGLIRENMGEVGAEGCSNGR